jgi:hypothetical protein
MGQEMQFRLTGMVLQMVSIKAEQENRSIIVKTGKVLMGMAKFPAVPGRILMKATPRIPGQEQRDPCHYPHLRRSPGARVEGMDRAGVVHALVGPEGVYLARFQD